MTTMKCAVCGKDYEVDPKWEAWLAKNPEKAQCNDCRKAAFEKKDTKPAAKASGGFTKKSGKITAKMLRQAYDEVKAEFADCLDEVMPFVGGWTSTIAINNSKKGSGE